MTSTAHTRSKQVKDAMDDIAATEPVSPDLKAHPRSQTTADKWQRILAPMASLKLTVVLFSLGLFLVFAGTLALKHFGLWTAMKLYFRTFLAWVDIAIFFPEGWNVPHFKFPFPGGWTIGFLMLANLLAAHAVRFQVKAVGSKRLWGWVGMAFGLAILCIGLYFTVVSQPQITQGWWQATGRVEGVSASLLGSFLVLYTSIILFSKRAGIFLTHAGIILLLVGELLTGLLAVESQMRIAEGETVNYAANIERSELAFVYNDKTGSQQAMVVPASMLTPGVTIDDARLPVKVKIEKYFTNAKLVLVAAPPEARMAASKALKRQDELKDNPFKLTEQEVADANAIIKSQAVTPELQARMLAYFKDNNPDYDSIGWREQMLDWMRWHAYGGYDGREWILDVAAADEMKADTGALADSYLLRELPETKGTDATNPDFAGAFVTLIGRDNKTIGTYLLHLFDDDGQAVPAGDKNYRVYLRFERYYKPYAIYAKDVRADKFTGSMTPRNYSTQLIRYDENHKTGEEVIIRMNEPMRFSGETFYQSQVAAVRKTRADGSTFVDEAGATVLQVVSNPGYLMPYIACIVVSVGLSVHFGITLFGYVRKQMK